MTRLDAGHSPQGAKGNPANEYEPYCFEMICEENDVTDYLLKT
jgi:hypothetical protein